MNKLQIGIIGSAGPEEYQQRKPNPKAYKLAQEIGKLLAQNNVILVCGGKGGIMESACKGAKLAGGITVGVVSGNNRGTCNRFVDVDIVSGVTNYGEEALIVSMSDAIIIVGGGAGTLQEMATAYRNGKPMVVVEGLDGWGAKLANSFLDYRKKVRIKSAKTAAGTVKLAIKLAKRKK